MGAGHVAPNPMVGALLVHNNRIIGEGYHQRYGEAHAEVNCLSSVREEDKHLVSESVMYVSLEPCAHFGKTPPCADLIVRHKIPKVVIGCRDPFPDVDGKGIEKLQRAGVEVITGVLEQECKMQNKRFLLYHTLHRPYIILKWAQTMDARIARPDFGRIAISNEYSNRMVHRWRSEEAAILVGTNTVLHDNPMLTTRLWPGPNPVRLVIDKKLSIPATSHIFDGSVKTIVFNEIRHEEEQAVSYYQVTTDVSIVHQVVHACYQLGIQSILVEGGAQLLQSFIDEAMWDEARVITNTAMVLGNGLPAPVLTDFRITSKEQVLNDLVHYYVPEKESA